MKLDWKPRKGHGSGEIGMLGHWRAGAVEYNSLRAKGETGNEWRGWCALSGMIDSGECFADRDQAKDYVEARVSLWIFGAGLRVVPTEFRASAAETLLRGLERHKIKVPPDIRIELQKCAGWTC
ncbi:MAG: hypothetical protein OXC91_00785 [Rhodobacteraceae bacterium]|nr:hypothetical protein [Paracoccaceae bacterium]